MDDPLHRWMVAPSFIAAAMAVGLAVLILRRRSSTLSFAATSYLWLHAITLCANGSAVLDSEHALLWRRVASSAEIFLPAALLWVGQRMSVIEPRALRKEQRKLIAVAAVAVSLGAFVWQDVTFVSSERVAAQGMVLLTPVGQALCVFILITTVWGITQLEQILRASRDPVRYQIKFLLIGIGALASYQVYQAVQLLLLPVWRIEQAVLSGAAALAALCLVAYGIVRTKMLEITAKVQLSQRLLYRSVTIVAVGLYLVIVGLIGAWLQDFTGPLGFDASVLVMFVAIVGLVVMFASRRVRAEARLYVARHFYRSKYDYREKWMEVTRAFQRTSSVEAILDELLDLLGRTFGAERISIWLLFEADRRFHQVRSLNTMAAEDPLDMANPIAAALAERDSPLDLACLSLENDLGTQEFLRRTWGALCVPIKTGAELLGFIMLSQDINGLKYDQDDLDLLSGIAYQVGVLLSHAQLAEERTAAAGLQALHRFSAFCLHDIKNLAGRLSLVVQNAKVYGGNPEFQQVAMRTIEGTVVKMAELISKLSIKAEDKQSPNVINVEDVVEEVVSSLNGSLNIEVKRSPGEARVRFIKDQLHQVLLNLILNAHQAAGEKSPLTVSVQCEAERVIIVMNDRGPGIREETLRTLFRPFQSRKETGLGVGLYQCKQMIEAQGGTIRIESRSGHGTTARIELPRVTSALPVKQAGS